MPIPPFLQLVPAKTSDDLDRAHRLIQELIDWDVGECKSLGFGRDEIISTFYPDALNQLRGHGEPPAGVFLLAILPGGAAGCAAFRRFSADACELYDVYVADRFRGEGVGAALIGELLRSAKAVGYQTMYLETAPYMKSAINLYRSLGFETIPPYRPLAARFDAITIAMQCAL